MGISNFNFQMNDKFIHYDGKKVKTNMTRKEIYQAEEGYSFSFPKPSMWSDFKDFVTAVNKIYIRYI